MVLNGNSWREPFFGGLLKENQLFGDCCFFFMGAFLLVVLKWSQKENRQFGGGAPQSHTPNLVLKWSTQYS